MAIVWYDISWNLNYLHIVNPEVVLHNTLEYSHATIFSGLCFKHAHSFRFPNSNRAVHDCCWMALVCQLLYSTTNYTHTVHECFVIKSFVFFVFLQQHLQVSSGQARMAINRGQRWYDSSGLAMGYTLVCTLYTYSKITSSTGIQV